VTDPVTKCPQWSDSCPTRLTPVDALDEPTVTTVAAPVLAAAPVVTQHPVQDRLVHMQLRVPVPGVVLQKRGDDELVASIHCPALAPCPTRA